MGFNSGFKGLNVKFRCQKVKHIYWIIYCIIYCII